MKLNSFLNKNTLITRRCNNIYSNYFKMFCIINFKVKFLSNNKIVDVVANEGDTFLDVIEDYEFADMGLCGGNISCSTCHINLPDSLLKSQKPQTEEEKDLLKVKSNNSSNSRLGCQVIINKNFNDSIIEVPFIIDELKDKTKIDD